MGGRTWHGRPLRMGADPTKKLRHTATTPRSGVRGRASTRRRDKPYRRAVAIAMTAMNSST